MAIDTSIYNALRPVQIDSPIDNYAKVAQLQQAQSQNKLAQLTLQQHQRTLDADNALASLLAPGAKPEDVVSGLAKRGFGERALSYQKQIRDQQKTDAEVAKDKASAAKSDADTSGIVMGLYRDKLTTINDPQSAAQWAASMFADPRLKGILSGTPEEAISRIPTDPAGFAKWKLQASLNAEKLIKYTTPDANTVANNMTSIQTTNMNNDTSRANTAATNATSRANNAATISKDYAVAGLNKDGTISGEIETTARAIASGQLPPPSGMALTNPRNQRVLARVMEINPDYDYTTVAAKKKAATDFTSGQQGNAMRSFAVAGQHLDQLGQLVDAMNNGNSQLVNRIANAYSQQTGNPAVTNFDAAKDVVSKEVVKAIVAGGGGVSERQELSDLMKNAKSPAQLKGVIAQYRNLMAAQHDALLQQRRAAGLKDSTLPNYAEANGSAPAVPATNSKGWALHRDANGNQAYVSPDGKQYEEVR